MSTAESTVVSPAARPPRSLVAALSSQAAQRPDATAFIYLEDGETRESRIAYGALAARARAIAAHLRTVMQQGDRVLVVLPPGLGYITGIFGCLYAGGVAVPVYPPDLNLLEQSLAAIRAVAADAGISVVLTVGPLVPPMRAALAATPGPAGPGGIRFVTLETIANVDGDADAAPSLDEASLAVLLYTSGSTGAPKGVMLSHGNFLHNAAITVAEYGLVPGDVMCTWVPPYHVSGLFSGIFLPVTFGGVNVSFSPLAFLESPIRWLRAIDRYRAIASGCPTFAYDLCVATVKPEEIATLDLRSWTTSLVGGEAVRKESLERFAARFAPAGLSPPTLSPMYGLTESTMISTAGRMGRFPIVRALGREALQGGRAVVAEAGDASPVYTVSSGRPMGDLDVRVVDPGSGAPLTDDDVGEIWVSGRSVALGYWQRPVETAAAFGAALSSSGSAAATDLDARRYLRTGDLGYLHDGELYVVGRAKELIIVRGLKYYPEDLERTVAGSDPLVARATAAAFAVEDEGEERLYLAVELSARPDDATLERLATTIRRAVGKNHGVLVRGFVFVGAGAITRTRTGKLQRHLCARRLRDGAWQATTLAATPTDGQGADASAARPRDVAAELAAMAEAARLPHLRAFVRSELGALLGIATDAAGGEAGAIDLDRPLADLGLDSVMVVMLQSRLRTALGRDIPISRFFEPTSIAAFVRRLLDEAEGRSAATAATVTDDLAALLSSEARLDPSIAPSPGAALAPSPAAAIFLTGATGFLGAALLHRLLSLTTARVHCLVRASSASDGHRRRVAALHNYAPDAPVSDEHAARIVAVPGELMLPRFGLSEAAWQALADEVHAVYHNGAAVNFVAGYAALRSANVSSVKEVLRLSCAGLRKPVHFVSTLAVWNSVERREVDSIREDAQVRHPALLVGGYAQSKWVAEALITQAGERGVPVTIYRPGFITGHSERGDGPTDDFFARFLKGGVELGALPRLPVELDLVPVDFVSEAIVRISLTAAAAGRTYHLRNPLAFSSLVAWMQRSGYPVRAIPVETFLGETIRALPTTSALYPLLPFFLESVGPAHEPRVRFLDLFAGGKVPRFDSANTDAALADLGIPCPAADDRLLATCFGHYARVGFLSPAPLLGPSVVAGGH